MLQTSAPALNCRLMTLVLEDLPLEDHPPSSALMEAHLNALLVPRAASPILQTSATNQMIATRTSTSTSTRTSTRTPTMTAMMNTRTTTATDADQTPSRSASNSMSTFRTTPLPLPLVAMMPKKTQPMRRAPTMKKVMTMAKMTPRVTTKALK